MRYKPLRDGLMYMRGCVQVICKSFTILYIEYKHSKSLVSTGENGTDCLGIWEEDSYFKEDNRKYGQKVY